MWKYVTGAVVAGTITYSLHRYFSGGVCHCPTRLDDLTVVITGANSGIGLALALELAKRGTVLVLGCRDVVKGLNAKKYILSKLSDKNVRIYVKEIDLASIASILRFVESVKSDFCEIYALVNNAAIFYHPQQLTVDGFDITFQVNYLAPFILTHHLLGLLQKSDHGRIVNVASEAHRTVNAYDLKAVTRCQSEFRSHFTAYGVSKLALIFFTRVFSKTISNTNIIVNAANPGNVETNIFRHFPLLNNRFLYTIQWPVRLITVKSPKQGAQTPLHCLLTSNRSTGQYYSDCKLALASPLASDEKLAREYYEITLDVLKDKVAVVPRL